MPAPSPDLLIRASGLNDIVGVSNTGGHIGDAASVVHVFGGAGYDWLQPGLIDTWSHAIQFDFHGGRDSDYLQGSHWDDSLFGGGGDDFIEGGGGNDLIVGGGGRDMVYGDGGADTFRFNARFELGDEIGYFTSGVDHIEIAAKALSPAVSAGDSLVLSQGHAVGREAQFVFDGSSLWFDRDGERRRAPMLIADFNHTDTLLASDIFVI